MKTQKLKLSASESAITLQTLWQEVSEKSQAEISGGGSSDGPACYPDRYYMPRDYIIGNEGGREGEYSGSFD